jgi:hypothetical protein
MVDNEFCSVVCKFKVNKTLECNMNHVGAGCYITLNQRFLNCRNGWLWSVKILDFYCISKMN